MRDIIRKIKNWVTTVAGLVIIILAVVHAKELPIDVLSTIISAGLILIWAKDGKALNLIKLILNNKKNDTTGNN